MNLSLVVQFIETPTDALRDKLLDDRETVFWVDWGEEDDAIAEYCESVLQTGSLTAELVEADNAGGYEIHILYRNRRHVVPLVFGVEDRHLTLVTLNQALSPEYEIRLCRDSSGDTLAFLPLASEQWRDLERRDDDAVAKRFYRLQQSPNVLYRPAAILTHEASGWLWHSDRQYDIPRGST